MGSKLSKAAREATGKNASSTKPGAMARPHDQDSKMADIKVNDIISAAAREAVAPPLVEETEMTHTEARDVIAEATRDGIGELLAKVQAIKNDFELFELNAKGSIDSGAIDVVNELNVRTLKIMSDLESVGIDGQMGITSIAEDVRQELGANFISIKEALERVGIDEREGITSIAEDVRRELDAKFISIKEAFERVRIKATYSIECATESGVRKIELVTEENMRKINALNEKEYVHERDEMLRTMMNHYAKTLSHVSTSPLNDWVQACLDDIYMPPNVQLMKNDKGSFMKTGTQITEYRSVFLTNGKPSRHTFIQGEAGSGKSTFLAKLVLDWCSTNSTKSVEPLPTALTNSADGDSTWIRTNFFKDLETLISYMFIFHVTLRDSVQEFEISDMIKQQIIDTIYSTKDRANAYNLLNEIMKRERCLVLLDGLDEWTGTVGHNLPTLAVSLSQCDILITTRPWKMTQSNIPDSKIDTLLQLEGVNEPFDVSKRLLACRGDYKESRDLNSKQSEFESYVFTNDLYELLVSPMLLSLIVQSWAEGAELKGSRCEIYILLLESLLKKANSETSEFQRPPFRCFTGTQYIKPNNEQVDCLAEAAFYLLFSDKRENSLVFSITELTNLNSKFHEQERLDFALKSGILSATRKGSVLRSSSAFSFIHKSLQEFLAAYHIARNTNIDLIDQVIAGYLHRHNDAYLDMSQVFIFLCGLDIMAANKLSCIMDKRNNARVKSGFDDQLCRIIPTRIQRSGCQCAN
ncbi:uncharacterized protein LOC127853277 [Dreissena polymorpha]|uniref:NACHT domain-containing protein n=1 Tax=Dreissena polymorpha TaxID=45954 RepID=A0A9D4N8B0_DREPO|nr:uncharacterized protein LOC127853277 [Dreissena polymorpha]XP_052243623.1 uncharacterized protein LOC127853277 [Dreissena polymorpha]XP_052243632.1 uncharacterized protein LOC127853277 [Dreissena polymorpha]XP_052243639.1 uncharacterized protein LOC127853277 [Dreissena polymorpha]XP_052243648.1 uncharacterized protein LOC127853277 [Dreissena polymorpha]KAH3890870.1 hypothetical protein DPMN_014959 [Dreissena polymorpha]